MMGISSVMVLSLLLGVVSSRVWRLSQQVESLASRLAVLEIARMQTRLAAYIEETPNDAPME